MNKVPISPQLIDRLADRPTDRQIQTTRTTEKYVHTEIFLQTNGQKEKGIQAQLIGFQYILLFHGDHLPSFLFFQVSSLNKEENKRDTIVDRVFRKALQEFHVQLISSYSVLMKVYQAWHSNTSFFVRYLSAIQSTKYSVLQLYVAFSFLARQIVNSEL